MSKCNSAVSWPVQQRGKSAGRKVVNKNNKKGKEEETRAVTQSNQPESLYTMRGGASLVAIGNIPAVMGRYEEYLH